MADISAPKASTPSNSSSASALKSDSNTLGGVFGVLKLPSSGPIPRGRAATVASSANANAAQEHRGSYEEVESPQPKRVKKVTFTGETKARLSDDHTKTSTSSTFTTSAFTTPSFTTPAPSSTPNVEMTEVRARAARHKGQMNFEAERTSAAL